MLQNQNKREKAMVFYSLILGNAVKLFHINDIKFLKSIHQFLLDDLTAEIFTGEYYS